MPNKIVVKCDNLIYMLHACKLHCKKVQKRLLLSFVRRTPLCACPLYTSLNQFFNAKSYRPRTLQLPKTILLGGRKFRRCFEQIFIEGFLAI